jgi:glycosyltransferase involved in cell wall biosynthesis
MATISILTATLNAASVIDRLGADLAAQTDCDFTWIVVDGGSTDGTTERLPQALRGRIVLVQERDFGIYDALNKGVRRCESTHYLVAGADDRLDPDAVERYRGIALETDADIVAASVRDDGRIALPGRGKSWLRGQNAFISHHSVGTLIRRSLHDRIGLYSAGLPIAADQLFIKTAVRQGARVHFAPEFVAGEFSRTGVSGTRYLATLFDFTLVQMKTESSRSLQLLLLIVRLVRHWREALR